jgi:hypothetical protein
VRLYGFSTRRSKQGVRGAFVPLGALTVLLGANDAGKSTLLAALDEDLRGGPPPPVGDEAPTAAGALYVTVSERELERLLPRPASGANRVSTAWAQGGYTDHLDAQDLERGRDAYLVVRQATFAVLTRCRSRRSDGLRLRHAM